MSSPTDDHVWRRLEDQIGWYDRRSVRSQRRFKGLKIVEITSAALIPFAAGFGLNALITASLGVVIVVAEGLQQLNQYHHNWITYRSTCEALKHEKHLYLANAGLYASADDPRTLLAERVEQLVSQEHTKWIAVQQQAGKAKRGSE